MPEPTNTDQSRSPSGSFRCSKTSYVVLTNLCSIFSIFEVFLVWSRSILIQRRASFDRTRFLQWFNPCKVILIKAEERSMIQILFRTQDPNIKTGTIRNPRQKLQLIHDPLSFQNPIISARFTAQIHNPCAF